MKIDISSINLEEFQVQERPGNRFLVTPRHTKHVWEDSELHLRSLLLDRDGNVLSSGFQKFVNYGEKPEHDKEFLNALKMGGVAFGSKADGSLIICDRIKGKPHIRTRGSDSLGEFKEPVMDLIRSKYPKLLTYLERDTHVVPHHSLLFEFLSDDPTLQIVVQHDEPDLVFLGTMDKRTITPTFDRFLHFRVSHETGVPMVQQHTLPKNLDELLQEVRSWNKSEGVVARFLGTMGRPYMIKIKSEWYLTLHALKYRFSPANVYKAAFLLGITEKDEIFPALNSLGLDWEACQFVCETFEQYIDDRDAAVAKLERFIPVHAEIKSRCGEDRKAYVRNIQKFLTENSWQKHWFHIALQLYDGKEAEALRMLIANEVLHVSPITVRGWEKCRQSEIQEMFGHGCKELGTRAEPSRRHAQAA